MLIYHKKDDMCSNAINVGDDFKKRRKSMKKGYKSTGNRKQHVIRAKVLKRVGRKKTGVSGNKKKQIRRKKTRSTGKKQLLKSNVQFLETLGLKVKA